MSRPPTNSDHLLVHLVNQRLLALEGLSILIQAIKEGTFKSHEVMLQAAEDILIRDVDQRHKSLSTSESAGIAGVPRIVLQGVIDVLSDTLRLSETRNNKFSIDAIDACEQNSHNAGFENAKSTLENMALVHSSWALMVYRVIGRQMLVAPGNPRSDGRDSMWDSSFRNPLYGPWTRTVKFSIKQFVSEFDLVQRSFYLSKLPLRFPHLKKVELGLPNFATDLSTITEQLLHTLNLEELTIERTERRLGELGQIPSSFFQQIASSTSLRSLRMPFAGNEIQGAGLPAQFQPLIANRTFEQLQLNLIAFPNLLDNESPALEHAAKMLWRRRGELQFELEELHLTGLKRWGKQSHVRQPQQRQKAERLARFKALVENLTFLRIGIIEEWEPEEYDLSHCKALHALSVDIKEPAVAVFLNSIPCVLESLSLTVSSTEDFAVTDMALKSRLSSGFLPMLSSLRLRCQLFERYSWKATKLSESSQQDAISSIPLTFKACMGRNIRYSIWCQDETM